MQGRCYKDAIDLLKLVEANPRFDLARGILARALMATGDLEGARQQFEARQEIGLLQAELALVYIKQGKRDLALKEGCERLERALTDGSVLINWMRLDRR